MGSFFTSSSASQATTNSQLGVQGGTGSGATVGIGSGNTGAAAGGAGSTAISGVGGSNVSGGETINITTSDSEALDLANHVTTTALNDNSAVAEDSINSSEQDTIAALSTVEELAGEAGTATNEALASNAAIAGEAAPQSAGYTAENLAATSTVNTKYLAIAGVALAAFLILKKD